MTLEPNGRIYSAVVYNWEIYWFFLPCSSVLWPSVGIPFLVQLFPQFYITIVTKIATIEINFVCCNKVIFVVLSPCIPDTFWLLVYDFIFAYLYVIHCFILLVLVQKRIEELACASGDQVEAVSNLLNKVTLGSKGSTMAHQLSTANSSNIVYTDEFDTSVAILNIVCFMYAFK